MVECFLVIGCGVKRTGELRRQWGYSLAALIRNSDGSCPAIHAGGRPRPLHVSPVAGFRYFAGGLIWGRGLSAPKISREAISNSATKRLTSKRTLAREISPWRSGH